tara:strand:- start:2012 stop:2326 length:315 start_codon:yes stop_codon:yes gene_type:complete
MPGTIVSPTTGEKYLYGTSDHLLDAYCTIDGTQLVSTLDTGISCFECKANYFLPLNPDLLEEHARMHLQALSTAAEDHRKRLERWDMILGFGRKKGLLEDKTED